MVDCAIDDAYNISFLAVLVEGIRQRLRQVYRDQVSLPQSTHASRLHLQLCAGAGGQYGILQALLEKPAIADAALTIKMPGAVRMSWPIIFVFLRMIRPKSVCLQSKAIHKKKPTYYGQLWSKGFLCKGPL